MRRNRLIIFISMTFVLALIGGGAAGVLATRFLSPAARVAPASPLTLEDLQLTAAQRAQIRQIWEGIKQASDQAAAKARLMNQDREDKLAALLSQTQKSQYAKIVQDYNDQVSELGAQRQKSLDHAIEKTRRLLSDPQRQAYDTILKSRLGAGATDDAAPSSNAGALVVHGAALNGIVRKKDRPQDR